MAGWLRPTGVALLLFATGIAARAASDHAPGVVLLKLRAEGPAAVSTCAEGAWRSGRPLSGSTADGSDSLDRLQQRLAVREVRAVFRRPDGRSFASQRRRLLERLQARRARAAAAPVDAALPDLSHVYRLRLGPGVDAVGAAASFRADPHVEWAQPDYLLQTDFVPDDPYFHSAESWGQPYADLWNLERIRAPEAWEYTQGEGAVVAVVDTGLDTLHPDIAENVWVNPGEDLDGDGSAEPSERNGVDDDGNGFVDDLIGFDFYNSFDADGDGDFDAPEDLSDADPSDDNGHGTHVAGIVAAVGNNGQGIIGVAPRAHIMALKGFSASGSGPSSVLARAVVYAAENGADAINTSWSCGRRCPENPLIDEAVILAYALGSAVVDSAGNSGDDVVFYSPEKLRETLVVAATSVDDSIASFSNRGFLLDVAAPGAPPILSLLAAGAPDLWSEGARVGDAYVIKRGTSMSTPHVAGVVALVRSLRPDATPDEIRALLRASARDLGAPGHDRLFGAGIVDALAAVTQSAPRVRGVLAEPGPGAIVDARAGSVALRGSANGEDFARYALAFGRGVDPGEWQPLRAESSTPVTEGLLAEWDVGALADGTYVLRLDVTSRGGELVREFLPLSLERNRPFPISSAGLRALAPDVSGPLVVWEAESQDPLASREILARDLRGSFEIPVALEPGAQRFPRVSGRRIAFLDRGRQAGGEIATCVVHGMASRCDARHVASGPETRSAPVLSGNRILWTETDAAGTRAKLCDLRHGAMSCSPHGVALRSERPLELELDGSQLVWHEQSPISSLWTCRLDPRNLACPAQLVNDDLPYQFAPGVSRGFFAFEQFSIHPGFGIGSQVYVCHLDPTLGTCPPVAAGPPVAYSAAPDISADTVVWQASEVDEEQSIHFCEYDPVTRNCPAQRLTGSAAYQARPAIDGRRVVFEDIRDGTSRIYGFDLPDLAVRGLRRLREGEWLRVEIRGRGPSREPMLFAAELEGGAPVESLGMRLRMHGDRALLSWRPGPGAAGYYTVLLRGTTPGHLVTRETLEIVVEPARPRRR